MTSAAVTQHRDATSRNRSHAGEGMTSRLFAPVLRVPLLFKLLGANALLVAGALTAHHLFPRTSTALEVTLFLIASFALTGWLVWIALGPIQDVEHTAARVSQGDFSARAPTSRVADRDIGRLTGTMNRLLDRVEADRARIHYLAGRGVRAREIERENVARELRESFAQTLSGIAMQLAAAQHEAGDSQVSDIIAESRKALQNLTDDMRSVAETLYPGTLEVLGLLNAIDALARRVARRSRIEVLVERGTCDDRMDPKAANALYRVVEEALGNIEQHARATRVSVRLACDEQVTLIIEDNGRGIDMKMNDPLQAGLGLFSARAMLALAGGELQISSGPGLGTQVIARVPSGIARQRGT